jgi:epoxyqueuosine reductase
MSLTDAVKRRAAELGFCAVGVTSAAPFREAQEAATERTRAGLMDGLSWWSERRAQASGDPRRATPDARSVIALAFAHPLVEAQPPDAERDASSHLDAEGPRGRIAAYALGRDYHEVLSERMTPLVDMLRERGHMAKTYVDHGWMVDRAAAARAGVGWLGKNTNLLVPGIGSYVLLAEIVTSAELDADEPLKKSCGSCDACMRVCPTGALIAPGVLDNRRCISFWTIEHRGVIPLDVRPLIGDWIFGCDLCQEVCPINDPSRSGAPSAANGGGFGPAIEARPELEALLLLDDSAFRDRFRGTPLWRARRAGLLRNVCVALGNIGDRSSLPALSGALADREPLVRGHAAWALGRLGGASARKMLEQVFRREDDVWVREECELALEACGPLVVP